MARPKTRTDEVRTRLLASAIELLEADGPTALRARRVAGAAGSSTGALYEFFGDKAGLVRAVFSEALVRLDALQAEVPITDDPAVDLRALLRAERTFALAHPMLHEVLAGRPFEEFDPTVEDTAVGRSLHRRGVAAVERHLTAIGSPLQPTLGAELVVALHRGLLASELAGQLGRTPPSRERKYRAGVELILGGLAGLDGMAR